VKRLVKDVTFNGLIEGISQAAGEIIMDPVDMIIYVHLAQLRLIVRKPEISAFRIDASRPVGSECYVIRPVRFRGKIDVGVFAFQVSASVQIPESYFDEVRRLERIYFVDQGGVFLRFEDKHP